MHDLPDAQVSLAVGAALGAGTTAIGRFLLGARRIDKVDAVQAVAAAYDAVAARSAAHIDDLSEQIKSQSRRIEMLEREIRKRDELFARMLTSSAGSPTSEG